MSKNHRNRNWRNAWTPERVSRIAVHKSGVVARVSVSTTNQANDVITLENIANLDLSRWDLGLIFEQAMKLWLDGKF